MKLFLAIILAFCSFLPAENFNATLADSENTNTENAVIEAEAPKTTRACWVIFGSEVICLVVETSIIREDIDVNVMFESSGKFMTMQFPSKVSGSLMVAETLKMDLCGTTKTISKGTKINVRNGNARISL